MPGWLSGWASAFSSGCDPRVLGLSPKSGSLERACFSLRLCFFLSLCVSHEQINKIFFFLKKKKEYLLMGKIDVITASFIFVLYQMREGPPRFNLWRDTALQGTSQSCRLSTTANHSYQEAFWQKELSSRVSHRTGAHEGHFAKMWAEQRNKEQWSSLGPTTAGRPYQA